MTGSDQWRRRRPDGAWIALVIGLTLVNQACDLPAPVAPRPDRIAWHREPRIATNAPELHPLVVQAIDDWGWGQLVAECLDADICVARDAMEGGRRAWGRASWDPGDDARCHAEVIIPSYAVVVHELGHCFGLGHSEDRRSLMHARTGTGGFQHLTRADHEALAAIRAEVPANRERLAQANDGWFEIRNARSTASVEGPARSRQ